MRKSLLVILAVLLTVTFASALFAQEGKDPRQEFQNKLSLAKAVSFSGEVLSHDVTCKCVVVKGPKGGTITMQDDYAKFEGEYDRAKGLKIGSKVKGTYKKVDYLNYLISIAYE
jgi:hypothetical protein